MRVLRSALLVRQELRSTVLLSCSFHCVPDELTVVPAEQSAYGPVEHGIRCDDIGEALRERRVVTVRRSGSTRSSEETRRSAAAVRNQVGGAGRLPRQSKTKAGAQAGRRPTFATSHAEQCAGLGAGWESSGLRRVLLQDDLPEKTPSAGAERGLDYRLGYPFGCRGAKGIRPATVRMAQAGTRGAPWYPAPEGPSAVRPRPASRLPGPPHWGKFSERCADSVELSDDSTEQTACLTTCRSF